MSGPWRVLVVGGGIAGMEVATGLGRKFGRRGDVEITLVDKALAHVWKPMLHKFAAGTAHTDREKISFAAQARAYHFRFVPGTLEAIDRAGRKVAVLPYGQDGDKQATTHALAYDRLVLAIGSRANDFGIDGVAEHCWTIDDLTGAEQIRAAIRKRVIDSIESDSIVDLAIVGGGATGVVLAAEAKSAVDRIADYGYASLPDKLRIVLIESGARLLPNFPQKISDAAAGNLAALGVEVRTGAQVSGVDADGFFLKSGERIAADLRVWAAGVAAPPAIEALDGVERSKSGQIVTDDRLRANGHDAILVLGDCGQLTPDGSDDPVPATAQAARQQARHVVRHAARWRRDGMLPPFRYNDRGSVIPLAEYNGWGVIAGYSFGGGRLKGLSARLIHYFLYRQHQWAVRGWWRGLAAWVRDGLDRLVSPPVRLD